jgi:TRAP-type C4-dicarboxylate transport system permease small subunit
MEYYIGNNKGGIGLNPNISQRIINYYDFLLRILFYMACVLVGFILCSVVLDALLRYFFRLPQIWVVELSEYSLYYICFLGTPWLLRQGGHTNIDILVSRFGHLVQNRLNSVMSIIGAVLCVVIFWHTAKITFKYFLTGYTTVTILEFPLWPLFAAIPLSMLLCSIEFILLARRYAMAEAKPLEERSAIFE